MTRPQGLITFEWAITLSAEVQLFWRNKITGATILFLLNRYFNLANFGFQVAFTFTPLNTVEVRSYATTRMCGADIYVEVSLRGVYFLHHTAFSLILIRSFKLSAHGAGASCDLGGTIPHLGLFVSFNSSEDQAVNILSTSSILQPQGPRIERAKILGFDSALIRTGSIRSQYCMYFKYLIRPGYCVNVYARSTGSHNSGVGSSLCLVSVTSQTPQKTLPTSNHPPHFLNRGIRFDH